MYRGAWVWYQSRNNFLLRCVHDTLPTLSYFTHERSLNLASPLTHERPLNLASARPFTPRMASR